MTEPCWFAPAMLVFYEMEIKQTALGFSWRVNPMRDATTLQVMRHRVMQRLGNVSRHVRWHLALQGATQCFWIAIVFCVASFLIDWKLELSVATRITLAFIVGVLLTRQVTVKILAYLRTRWSPCDIANLLDIRRSSALPEILPKVSTLFQEANTYDEQSSRELIREAARQSFWSLENIPFEDRINARRLRRFWLGLASGVLFLGVFFAVLPSGSLSIWMERWLAGKNSSWPRDTQVILLNAEDGTLFVPRGEPFQINVQTRERVGDPPPRVWIDVRYDHIHREQRTIERDSSGSFRQQFGGIDHVGTMYVRAGDARIGPIRIQPVERPSIDSMEIHTTHPRHNEAIVRDLLKGDRTFKLLPNTTAKLIIQADVPISMLHTENLHDRLATSGNQIAIRRETSSSFSAEWQHASEMNLQVQVVGRVGSIASLSRTIQVGLQEDHPPSLRLSSSDVSQRVTPNATIPLTVEARDDFGITECRLEASAKQRRPAADRSQDRAASVPSEFQPMDSVPYIDHEIEPDHAKAFEINIDLPLGEERLPVGSQVEVKARAQDNRHGEPHVSESNRLVFQIVSAEVMSQEIRLRQQTLRKQLQDEFERANDLKVAILSARSEQDFANLARVHRLNSIGVNAVYVGLAATKKEMERNRIGGDEAIRLVEQNLLLPLKNVWQDPMARQQIQLSQINAQMPRDQVDKTQQEIIGKIDTVLKNMAHWDSFAEVVSQLDAVIKMQKELQQDTEELSEQEIESVFD